MSDPTNPSEAVAPINGSGDIGEVILVLEIKE
jgi:hypothetical protein